MQEAQERLRTSGLIDAPLRDARPWAEEKDRHGREVVREYRDGRSPRTVGRVVGRDADGLPILRMPGRAGKPPRRCTSGSCAASSTGRDGGGTDMAAGTVDGAATDGAPGAEGGGDTGGAPPGEEEDDPELPPGHGPPPYFGLPPVLTVDEVAAFLRFNRKTVYDAIQRKELPARKVGRCARILRTALLDWLQPKERVLRRRRNR